MFRVRNYRFRRHHQTLQCCNTNIVAVHEIMVHILGECLQDDMDTMTMAITDRIGIIEGDTIIMELEAINRIVIVEIRKIHRILNFEEIISSDSIIGIDTIAIAMIGMIVIVMIEMTVMIVITAITIIITTAIIITITTIITIITTADRTSHHFMGRVVVKIVTILMRIEIVAIIITREEEEEEGDRANMDWEDDRIVSRTITTKPHHSHKVSDSGEWEIAIIISPILLMQEEEGRNHGVWVIHRHTLRDNIQQGISRIIPREIQEHRLGINPLAIYRLDLRMQSH